MSLSRNRARRSDRRTLGRQSSASYRLRQTRVGAPRRPHPPCRKTARGSAQDKFVSQWMPSPPRRPRRESACPSGCRSRFQTRLPSRSFPFRGSPSRRRKRRAYTPGAIPYSRSAFVVCLGESNNRPPRKWQCTCPLPAERRSVRVSSGRLNRCSPCGKRNETSRDAPLRIRE